MGSIRTIGFRARLWAALGAGALALAGCGSGTDAVAQGGTFEFVSPDGQLEIHYPEEERKPVAELAGPDLLEPDQTVGLADFKLAQSILSEVLSEPIWLAFTSCER